MRTRGRIIVIAAAATAFVVNFGFYVELQRSDFVHNQINANYVTLSLGAGAGALVIGMWIVLRRPRAHVGWLLAIAAITTGAGYYRFSTHPWLAASGLVVFFATSLLPLHAAVTAGEGIGRATRRLLIGASAVLTALAVTIAVTAPSGSLDRWFVAADGLRHVHNVFQRFDAQKVSHAALVAWWIVLLAAALVATVGRVRRWRRAPRRVRRTEAPAVFGAVIWVVLMAGSGGTMLFDRVPLAKLEVADFAAVALPAVGLALVAAVIGWVELLEPRLA